MKRSLLLILATIAMQSSTITGIAVAQETKQLSFQAAPENTEFTQQHRIDVGDRAEHHVRIFEHRSTFFKDAPAINGVALKEQLARGITDLTCDRGSGTVYFVHELASGDKFFARGIVVAYRLGSGFSATTAAEITGGTGKFAGMRGTIRSMVTVDASDGVSEGRTEIEYVLDGRRP